MNVHYWEMYLSRSVDAFWNHWLPFNKFLLKCNWKKKNWKVFFRRQSLGVQTRIPVSQTARIRHWYSAIKVPNISFENSSFLHNVIFNGSELQRRKAIKRTALVPYVIKWRNIKQHFSLNSCLYFLYEKVLHKFWIEVIQKLIYLCQQKL